MKRVYNFLIELSNNNNREWFLENKNKYVEAQSIFNGFVERLIACIGTWDETVKDSALSVKDCTYRIYRDARFSRDKSPYKTHMGAYICRGGKKSPYAGYYFHIEPNIDAEGFLGKSLLAAGLYSPEPKVIQSLRDEISVNGDSLLEAIALAKGFAMEEFNVLKRIPRGFENIEKRWAELIKHKDFSIGAPLPVAILESSEEYLLEYVSDRFKSCQKFNNLLNMAVDYALEEI